MSLLLLFIAFLVSLFGAFTFFTGYFGAENANDELTAAMVGIAFCLIPYIVAKTLAEMVAIRQRHLQMEQIAQFQFLLAEQLPEEEAEETAAPRQPNPPTSPTQG